MDNKQNTTDPNSKGKAGAPDESPEKDAEKLVEVRKHNDAEDRDNSFVGHEEPFDEQMFDPDSEHPEWDEQAD